MSGSARGLSEEYGPLVEAWTESAPGLERASTCGEVVDDPWNRLAPGSWLGRFRIERRLGAGGLGVVYVAWDPQRRASVALKLLLRPYADRARWRRRFAEEARVAAGLRHKHLVRVHEVGTWQGRPYMTQELVEGPSLHELCGRVGPVGAARLVAKVARALAYAHGRGVVHRDLKPENVLVRLCGEPVVVDFGLAKDHEQDLRLTQHGEVLGTPGFMAPEQLRGGEAGGLAGVDVYAMGALLYCLLTDRLPFEGSIHEVLLKVLNAPVEFPEQGREVPEVLREVCVRAMAKHPAQRQQSAEELAAELEAAAAEVERGRRGGSGRLARWVRGGRARWSALRWSQVGLVAAFGGVFAAGLVVGSVWGAAAPAKIAGTRAVGPADACACLD